MEQMPIDLGAGMLVALAAFLAGLGQTGSL